MKNSCKQRIVFDYSEMFNNTEDKKNDESAYFPRFRHF